MQCHTGVQKSAVIKYLGDDLEVCFLESEGILNPSHAVKSEGNMVTTK